MSQQLDLFDTDTRAEPAVLPQEPPREPEPAPTPAEPDYLALRVRMALEDFVAGVK